METTKGTINKCLFFVCLLHAFFNFFLFCFSELFKWGGGDVGVGEGHDRKQHNILATDFDSRTYHAVFPTNDILGP